MIISQPKHRYKPTVLDLFCGAGGMSLGFQNAGCHILAGIDNNPHAVTTHHTNFKDSTFKLPPIDITELNFQTLPLQSGDIDILIGAPPCQVFSRVGIGKMRSLDRDVDQDYRNFLYKHFVEAIDHFKPLCFVMENVDYLSRKPIFSTILDDLRLGLIRKHSSYPGYRVYHQVLTASEYGVPQVRKRLFIVGVRQDINVRYRFPLPSTLTPYSVRDAISDLIPLTPPYIPLRDKISGPKQTDFKKPYRCLPESEYQRIMRRGNDSHDGLDYVMNHICRAHNPIDIICFAMLGQGKKYMDLPEFMRRYSWESFDDKYKRLSWNKPSWTLTAHMRKDCLAYIHPEQNRSISVREAARLQSFPDNFIFDAPMTRMFELVGNSVPPLLAEAVAKTVVKLVLRWKSSENLSQENNDDIGQKMVEDCQLSFI